MESELCSRVPLPLFQHVHLIQTAISYLSRTRFIVLISFIHSVQNTLSVKLYQSVPSPMIIISTFRPTHQIKTNGTERKLKVSGRKSRLLFPSGPTPQNTAFSASQLQHRFFNPAPRVQGNGATSCTFRSAAVRSIREQKASTQVSMPPSLFHTPRFEHAPDKY